MTTEEMQALQALIPAATTTFLIFLCDLTLLLFLVLQAIGAASEAVCKTGLKIGFFVNSALILSFIGLAARAARVGEFGMAFWLLISICLSAMITSLAGFLALRSPWRFLPPALTLVTFVLLLGWFLLLRQRDR